MGGVGTNPLRLRQRRKPRHRNDLNDAFRFEKSFTYSTVWAGLLLFLFKVAVVGPVVGAFVVWWKLTIGKKSVRAA